MQKPSTKALYEYWNGLRGSRSAPDRRDIDPTRIRDALANTFILEREDAEGFAFRLAGSHLCTAYCRELKGSSFAELWHERDRDALETLVRAVTEDHAAALVTFQGETSLGTKAAFETLLLPLRHNGSTQTRLLGAMSVIEAPYWLGVQPIVDQRISGLRLIWPDEAEQSASLMRPPRPAHGIARSEFGATALAPAPSLPAVVYGRQARRYAHLAVIDGGRR